MANTKDDPVTAVVRDLPADVVDALLDHLTDGQLGQLVHALDEAYNARGIALWLTSRIRTLDARRPIELIQQGPQGVARVLEAAARVGGQ